MSEGLVLINWTGLGDGRGSANLTVTRSGPTTIVARGRPGSSRLDQRRSEVALLGLVGVSGTRISLLPLPPEAHALLIDLRLLSNSSVVFAYIFDKVRPGTRKAGLLEKYRQR